MIKICLPVSTDRPKFGLQARVEGFFLIRNYLIITPPHFLNVKIVQKHLYVDFFVYFCTLKKPLQWVCAMPRRGSEEIRQTSTGWQRGATTEFGITPPA